MHYGTEVNNLLNSILNFEPTFSWFSFKCVLQQTNIYLKYLQFPSISYATVQKMSKKTYDSLQVLRSEENITKCWPYSQFLVKNYEIFPTFYDQNFYYQISIYYPVINIVMKEIKDRFNENDFSILNSLMN